MPYAVRRSRAGRMLTTLVAVVVTAAVAGAAGFYLAGQLGTTTTNRPGTNGAADKRDSKITALGRLQPAGGVVPVYGPPGDRIGKLHPVAPGTALKASDPIAELASRKERLQEVQV